MVHEEEESKAQAGISVESPVPTSRLPWLSTEGLVHRSAFDFFHFCETKISLLLSTNGAKCFLEAEFRSTGL